MTVKLLTELHLEFLSLKGGCTGLSEFTLVKMPHCWKSHVMAQLFLSLKMDFILAMKCCLIDIECVLRFIFYWIQE